MATRVKGTPVCLYCLMTTEPRKKAARQMTVEGDPTIKIFCNYHHAYLWARAVLRKTPLQWDPVKRMWVNRPETPVNRQVTMPEPPPGYFDD